MAAAVVLLLAGASVGCSSTPSSASDLKRFEEIDLGSLQGKDALIGVTRSQFLPMVITRAGRGASSLAVVDAQDAQVIDAGAVPVDGWIGDGYPRASDRYVAMVTNICAARPREGDAGLECGGQPPADPAGAQLVAYEIGTRTWRTLRLDAASDQAVSLVDVDGTTATLMTYPGAAGEQERWATIDLSQPLRHPSFSTKKPPIRPNGLAPTGGRLDGWGWKATNTNGEATAATWTGTVGGVEKTVHVSTMPLRHLYGAGRCLVIGSYRPHNLDHLHRVCADP